MPTRRRGFLIKVSCQCWESILERPPKTAPKGLSPARMAAAKEKRGTVGASPSDALERVRRVEVPASSLSKVGQAWKKQYAKNVHAGL